MNLIDAAFDLLPMEYHQYKYLKINEYFYYSSSLLFHTKIQNNKYANYTLYRGNVIEYDGSHTQNVSIIYEEFTPEKFYHSNKVLINLTRSLFPPGERFYFLNGWNNWIEGSYLEPDTNYGYDSLNAFSKALFNLPYNSSKKYNLSSLDKGINIAIQAHVFYVQLIDEMLSFINNIPFKFDLYISTNTLEKKNIIENHIYKNNMTIKLNYYEIMVIENKGRDMIPMLWQMKNRISSYKYFCHIHSKTTNFTEFGNVWRHYLFHNLLGSKEIIMDILDTFVNKEEIGFIYPEVVYKYTKMPIMMVRNSILYLNSVINKLYPGYKMGRKFKYPLGNMFWAKVDAIKPFFSHKFVYMMDRNEAELKYKFEII